MPRSKVLPIASFSPCCPRPTRSAQRDAGDQQERRVMKLPLCRVSGRIVTSAAYPGLVSVKTL